MKTDWMAKSEGNLLIWADKFLPAVTEAATTFGLTPEDITEITGVCTGMRTAINNAAAKSAAAQQATLAKKPVLAAAKTFLRELARRLKAHKNYTEPLGAAMGIIGSDDATDMTQAQPVLVGAALGKGQSEIAFNKMQADGVNLYYEDGGQNWVFLARDTQSPYVDNRPLATAGKPEMRRYMAKFVIGDQEVGYESDAITVAVTP
ncbi:MAG: hypothetical protein NT105_09235 [Verrucomicrobia bacterium]|nr:hypothetical protein [Verrucomicrobiota bacterium]